MCLAKWLNIDYNIGNHFDGSIFKAPIKGIYTFNACAGHKSVSTGHVDLDLNGDSVVNSQRVCSEGSINYLNLWLSTTLKLEIGDQISLALNGDLFALNDSTSTFFEGRLISKLDE